MEIRIRKYNDVWLDNGLATFSKLLKSLQEDEEDIFEKLAVTPTEIDYKISDSGEFVNLLSGVIEGKRKSLIIEQEDNATGKKKEVKKDHILVPEKKKIGGKVAFKEEIFDISKTREVISSIFEGLESGDKICFICGRRFNKNIKKLQQASYPFVTKIKSLSGIRSQTKKGMRLIEYTADYCR